MCIRDRLYYYIHLTAFFQKNLVCRRQQGKPFWILLEWEMMGWQWHQLDHMQIICTLLQTDNHASTSPLNFYRLDALPAAQPTASKNWRHISVTDRVFNDIMTTGTFPHILDRIIIIQQVVTICKGIFMSTQCNLPCETCCQVASSQSCISRTHKDSSVHTVAKLACIQHTSAYFPLLWSSPTVGFIQKYQVGKCRGTNAEIWWFFDFSRWRPPPSWIHKFS